jgi:hypothetical protein
MKNDEVLIAWQERWGVLDSEWATKFLKDPRIDKILSYPEASIRLAITFERKFDEIISYLENHRAIFENSLSQHKVVEAKDLKQKTSERPKNISNASRKIAEIYNWLNDFSLAQLDPENTFPRLLIKSDRETCQAKVAYSTEQEAIVALIELGYRKGEIIKQLPYKCNICRKFHNTHLISRETIQKLLSKYKKLNN